MLEKINIDQNWTPIEISNFKDIPIGDMPKDSININKSCVDKAELMFPKFLEELSNLVNGNSSPKIVVSVYGGSGVGKSVTAAIFACYLNSMNIGTYILSGDNYPHRIPEKNDEERLRIFRDYGIKGLVSTGKYTSEINQELQSLREKGNDLDKAFVTEYPWLSTYLEAGINGLKGYLGTKNEIDFDEINGIINKFKNHDESILLKRMGREENELWYDSINFSNTNVLIIEWTHGNNQNLEGIDIPILLHSTPEETLEYRRERGRDENTDTPLIAMVLKIEQKLLDSQAQNAKIIVNKAGNVISFDEYRNNY